MDTRSSGSVAPTGWTDLADLHPGAFSRAGAVASFLGGEPPRAAGVMTSWQGQRSTCNHFGAFRSVGLTDDCEVGVRWSPEDLLGCTHQVGPAAWVAPDASPIPTADIVSVSLSGSILTVTTATAHGFSPGMVARCSGFTSPTQRTINGSRHILCVPTATSFTVDLTPPVRAPRWKPPFSGTEEALPAIATPCSYQVADGLLSLSTTTPHAFASGGLVQLGGFRGAGAVLNGTELLVDAYDTTLVFATTQPSTTGPVPVSGATATELPSVEQHRPMGVSSVWDIGLKGLWYPLQIFNGPLIDVLEPSRYALLGISNPTIRLVTPGDHWVIMRCVNGKVAGYLDDHLVWGPIDQPSWAAGRDAWGFHVIELRFPIGAPSFDAELSEFDRSTLTFTTTYPHSILVGRQVQVTFRPLGARGGDPHVLNSATSEFPGHYEVTAVPSATTFTVASAPGEARGGPLPFWEYEGERIYGYQAEGIVDHESPVQITDWYARPYSGSF